MFISKTEKEYMKAQIKHLNVVVVQHERRIEKLEKAIEWIRKDSEPLVKAEKLPQSEEVVGFVSRGKRTRSPSPTPHGSLGRYAYHLVDGLRAGDQVEIYATPEFTVERLVNAVSAYAGRTHGKKACFVRTSKDKTHIIVVRAK